VTTIGHNIREKRWDARLNQAELARRVGVSRNAINRIELGYNNPSVETLKKIADVLGVSVDELYEEPLDLKADAPEPPIGEIGEATGLLEEVFRLFRKSRDLTVNPTIHENAVFWYILSHKPDVVARALLEAAKILNDMRAKSGGGQEDAERFFETLGKTFGGE